MATVVDELDGVLGTHRRVPASRARATIRRGRPDLVVAHDPTAAVAASVGRSRPPVVLAGRASARAGSLPARVGAICVPGLLPVDHDRWRDLVTGLLGPLDDPPPVLPTSLDDVLVLLPHADRRSDRARLVAGPDPGHGPMVLHGPAAAVLDLVDGHRPLQAVAEDVATRHDLDTATARGVTWEIAQRACRARVATVA